MTIEWIFFDCFNTLIDDFDASGDETGMLPIAHIPVEAGFFESADHYYQAYIDWRKKYWSGTHWDEVHLAERFRHVLLGVQPDNGHLDLEGTIDRMMSGFHERFPDTVRLTPGVRQMLDTYHGKVKMGVVSNFFLPGYPAQLLKNHGLDHYFDFILDSAEINSKKPGDLIYQKAMEQTHLDPEDFSKVLFIGDNVVNDALTPLRLGMKGMHFDRSDMRPGVRTSPDVPSIRKWSEFSPL